LRALFVLLCQENKKIEKPQLCFFIPRKFMRHPNICKTSSSSASIKRASGNLYPWHPQNAELVIDISNRITGCSPAASRLLGQSSERLAGQAIDSLIAELPFSANTPYYNLAYAVFHAANGTSLSRTASTADGAEIAVDITFSSTVMNGRRLITLNLAPRHTQEALAA
jgi:PAS domain S-box-containing protein